MEWVLEEFDDVICVDPSGFARARPAPRLPGTRRRIHGRWERDGMFLLRAVAQTGIPGVRFEISGGGTSKDNRDVRAGAQAPGVTLCPNIHELEHLAEFYRRMHVLVDLYRGDGSGRSVLEAMTSGRLVVRVRSRDTHPVVDGHTGVLVNPDVASISRVLANLATHWDWLEEVRRRGRAAIEGEYRRDLVLSKVEHVYRSCLSSS